MIGISESMISAVNEPSDVLKVAVGLAILRRRTTQGGKEGEGVEYREAQGGEKGEKNCLRVEYKWSSRMGGAAADRSQRGHCVLCNAL